MVQRSLSLEPPIGPRVWQRLTITGRGYAFHPNSAKKFVLIEK